MSKVKPILYMLGKGGISVLQTGNFVYTNVKVTQVDGTMDLNPNLFMPPFEKGGHIALHLSVGRYVGMSVGMSVALNLVQLITQ